MRRSAVERRTHSLNRSLNVSITAKLLAFAVEIGGQLGLCGVEGDGWGGPAAALTADRE